MTIVADKVFVRLYSTALLPESVRKNRKMAGLLTCSVVRMPSHFSSGAVMSALGQKNSGLLILQLDVELTAAGLFRSFT